MAGTPSAALPDRVRSSLGNVPERRGPYWIAGLAAAVIAVVLIGVLVVANPLNRPANTIAPGVGSSPTASASPAAPPDSNLPAFVCASSSLGPIQAPAVVFIDALRIGTHPGYDRLTVEVQNAAPAGVDLRPQAGTGFTQGASGH